jgi:hypothetical protein
MVINRILLSALALLATTTFATAEYRYVGAGIVLEQLEDMDDDGIAGELNAGIVFDNNIGAEFKLTKTFVKSEVKESGMKGEFDATTLSLFATYNLAVSPEFTIMPKVGISYFSIDIDASYAGISGSDDDSSTNISFGIDAKYSLSQVMDLYVGFTVYNPDYRGEDFDANQFSFGIQQKF